MCQLSHLPDWAPHWPWAVGTAASLLFLLLTASSNLSKSDLPFDGVLLLSDPNPFDGLKWLSGHNNGPPGCPGGCPMDFTPAMLPLAVTVPRGHHDGPFCRASLHVALCGRAPCLSPSRSVLAVLEPVSIAQAPGSTALPSEDLGQWHL